MDNGDTTLLLLLGTITVIWWACVWGVFDALVQFTKRPFFMYSIGIVVIVAFLFANPHIADRLL